jgi:hypothetical protein
LNSWIVSVTSLQANYLRCLFVTVVTNDVTVTATMQRINECVTITAQEAPQQLLKCCATVYIVITTAWENLHNLK